MLSLLIQSRSMSPEAWATAFWWGWGVYVCISVECHLKNPTTKMECLKYRFLPRTRA